MQVRLVSRAKVRGKRVLLRAALNVPVNARGQVQDDWRLRQAVPTIQLLRRSGAIVILAGHLGRPKGKVVAGLRLHGVAKSVSKLLKVKIQMLPDSIGPKVELALAKAKPGQVFMLENLRFHKGEEQNSPAFAKALAKLADVYVDDAFDNAHRQHASMAAITKFLPSYAGLQLAAEVKQLSRALHKPRRPLVVIIGGAKISTKLGMVKNLLPKADHILLGGALANTLLVAQNIQVGRSIVDRSVLPAIRRLRVTEKKLKLPIDVIVSAHPQSTNVQRVAVGNVPPTARIYDIGPDTVALFQSIIRTAKMIIWNGTMGLAEQPAYAAGTLVLTQALARTKALTIVGGGETVQAVRQAGVERKIDFLSTGGGAMLAFLEGRTLPALTPLRKN